MRLHRSVAMLVTALAALEARAQQLPGFVSVTGEQPEQGWNGFLDVSFLLHAALTLTLAAALGLVIGYHPRRLKVADSSKKPRRRRCTRCTPSSGRSSASWCWSTASWSASSYSASAA